MNGKGSKPRPFSVPQEEFQKNWDEIFAKKTSVEVKTLDNGDEIIWTEQSDGTFNLNKK